MHAPTRIAVETVVARGTMIAVAVGIFAVGFSMLTHASAVPFTVALWLGGAAVAGLGLFGRLPRSGW
jgi:hypothetical protein